MPGFTHWHEGPFYLQILLPHGCAVWLGHPVSRLAANQTCHSSPSINAAAFSPIMIAGALVFPDVR